MKSIYKKYKCNSIFLKNLKKDFCNNNFPSSRRLMNTDINLVFPLYAPKVTFFKVSGKLKKNFKPNSLNQTLHLQSIVSKNKVKFVFSPNIPFVYIF